MKNVEVSIIVPVYNTEERLLANCIESLLKQNCTAFEVLIIDDGSEKMLSEFMDHKWKDNSAVRIVHRNNYGVSATRNYGVEIANGNYIIFVDSDDYVSSDMVTSLLQGIKRTGVQIVTSYIKPVRNMNYLFSNNDVMLHTVNNDSEKREMLKTILLGLNTNEVDKGYISGGPCALIINREYAMKYKFPEGIRYMEDVIWNYRVFWNSESFAILDKTTYAYLQNQTSATHTWSLSMIENRIQALNIIKEMIEDDSELMNAYAMRVLSSFSMICKCCAKTKEIQGLNSRLKTVKKYYQDPIWYVLKINNIDKNWSLKYRVKLWLARTGLLSIAYMILK
jgi:glycosyltransferase involved in cell wall biosynthesis